ncbi:Clavaminate synthase-like protein [Coemansia reversa NRRL 1564]|uniref:Clavaminate synthase-like protein n=1 Tax=Coemansia reversa (strain ATCC 12441 / NRRL 1564) TaxID=763665 RepID=A0A2G5B1K7_COERN|nr:Clavaminate synthase-like protein [Coemansia reversa NRRL 1564]|eukprot:PIA12884.1 Clavaminate synthase-like protein [Coemansia reversa NRRL 1564]
MLRITQRTRHTHPRAPWELPVAYVDADELSTREFSRLWSRGQVIVVRGLLSKLRAELWQPEWWISRFGYELVRVLDCARAAAPVAGDEWPLRDFFRLFDNDDRHSELFADASNNWDSRAREINRGILKLKDWPPAEDFHRRLPEHFEAFVDALPFPEYTHRDGVFNLAARLPATAVPPDLGPKMYCAYGSSDAKGGFGTTNLHCDMADAVNIMAYASPISHSDRVTAAAVWDIFPPHVVDPLREYIRKRNGANGGEGDPIHDQATFLTQPQREELFRQLGGEDGICYRVHQNPGDAVFVPAGCAHQVCNYASAVKVAMDFVSPERVDFCRKLTAEFRKLPTNHPRHADLLQLNNILWWAFAGNQPNHNSHTPKNQKQPKKKRAT